MSPLSTQLPAQQLEWEAEYYFPAATQNPTTYVGTGAGLLDRMARRPAAGFTLASSTAIATNSIMGYSGIGIGGATIAFDTLAQRRCMSCTVSGGAADRFATDWRPPDWLPHYGDPAFCAPGSMVLPGSVVGVFDWNLAVGLAGATPSWPNDFTGIFFQANEVSADTIPGVVATADVQGFGVFVNAVAGATAFEYVSWASGAPGAILKRVTMPVPNVAAWSTVRFVLITAASGRAFNVRVSMNGTQFVDDFAGTPVLDTIDASLVAGSTGPVNRIMVGPGPDTLFYQMNARFGRFTPEGVEVQGQ